jgi:hypothetical protein
MAASISLALLYGFPVIFGQPQGADSAGLAILFSSKKHFGEPEAPRTHNTPEVEENTRRKYKPFAFKRFV